MKNLTASIATALVATAVTSWSATTPAASQNADLEVGTLTCNVSGGGSFIVGSTKSLNCAFEEAGSGRVGRYVGEIAKVGLDIGVTTGGVIVWTVLAATNSIAPGTLSGSYSGVGAEAAVGVGAGAKLLVGGSSNSVSLQPLSVQGGTGLNIALAVETMTLRWVP